MKKKELLDELNSVSDISDHIFEHILNNPEKELKILQKNYVQEIEKRIISNF